VKLLAFAPRSTREGPSGDSPRIGFATPAGIHDLTTLGIGDMASAISAGTERLQELAERVEQSGASPIGHHEVAIRAPLARPGKIVGIGLNYRDHCREQAIEPPPYPRLFAKFANAVNDPGAPIIRPAATEKLDLECELAVVIGQRASHVGRDEALDAVFGYTILNDVTMRDLQAEDRQWLRAKGSDGFAPMGPVLVTRDEIADPQALRLRSFVNGEPWQDSTTAEMVFDVRTIIAFVSRFIRLEPGDVIATGTPAGVGHYQRPPRYLAGGDALRCEIEGIGALLNTVIDEAPRIRDHAAAAGVGLAVGAGAQP
jgi:2-keto-4-pentenoate hydratase/2-oxohepta-3-ene-1,7-dioic acid hydratase in catechol pathway